MKINHFYYRSHDGYYYRPVWSYFGFYVDLSGLIALACGLVQIIFPLSFVIYICYIALLVFIVTAVGLVAYFIKRSKENGSFLNFLAMSRYEAVITRDFVDTQNKNRLKDVPFIRIPWVKCTLTDDRIWIEISKIAGLKEADIDGLRELIDSDLTGRFANFAVSEQLVSDNRLEFEFWAEDVASDLTWTPKTVNDLKQKPYILKLQDGLEINLAERPNLGVWGAVGSGKSTVVFACVAQLLSAGSTLIFLDGKSEYSAFSLFYPKQRFLTDADSIERALKYVVDYELPKRQKIVEKATKKSRKIGLRGYDIGLTPLVIVADEIGNLAGTPKQRKAIGQYLTTIMQRGRSISCFVIWATQDPAVSASMSVLSQGAMSQLSTKILLSTAKPEVQREVFGDVATKGNVPHFRGYYVSNGLTAIPKKFYVPNLYKNHLSKLDTFEKLYTEQTKKQNEMIHQSVQKKI